MSENTNPPSVPDTMTVEEKMLLAAYRTGSLDTVIETLINVRPDETAEILKLVNAYRSGTFREVTEIALEKFAPEKSADAEIPPAPEPPPAPVEPELPEDLYVAERIGLFIVGKLALRNALPRYAVSGHKNKETDALYHLFVDITDAVDEALQAVSELELTEAHWGER